MNPNRRFLSWKAGDPLITPKQERKIEKQKVIAESVERQLIREERKMSFPLFREERHMGYEVGKKGFNGVGQKFKQ